MKQPNTSGNFFGKRDGVSFSDSGHTIYCNVRFNATSLHVNNSLSEGSKGATTFASAGKFVFPTYIGKKFNLLPVSKKPICSGPLTLIEIVSAIADMMGIGLSGTPYADERR